MVLWFLFRCIGCVEFEKDNVAVLHHVVPALLPVFSSSLWKKTHLNCIPRTYLRQWMPLLAEIQQCASSSLLLGSIKHTPWLHFHCPPLWSHCTSWPRPWWSLSQSQCGSFLQLEEPWYRSVGAKYNRTVQRHKWKYINTLQPWRIWSQFRIRILA